MNANNQALTKWRVSYSPPGSGHPDQQAMTVIACGRCGRAIGEARDRDRVDGAVCVSCLLPACYRCGQPGQVPLRKHGLALCLECYLDNQRTTVEVPGEPVPV